MTVNVARIARQSGADGWFLSAEHCQPGAVQTVDGVVSPYPCECCSWAQVGLAWTPEPGEKESLRVVRRMGPAAVEPMMRRALSLETID